MTLSPFHALLHAHDLSSFAFGNKQLVPVFASSIMEIYPFQVTAARFALRSPYLKGVILCDDGALGKSFEAMLVAIQHWVEGKSRILLIIPTPLLKQWSDLLNRFFSIPFMVIDQETVQSGEIAQGGNPFLQDGFILTTYDYAYEKADMLSQVDWELAIYEEAHCLRRIYTGENKRASTLRAATKGAFKILLTATPMQNSIMDLYGLIYFIDEHALPDPDSFYKRYFRKPENYPELYERVSKYCYRTTRAQVASYVKIPKRLPLTAEYVQAEPEQALQRMLDAYLAREIKAAFPQMDLYDLTLMLNRALSSSTFALLKTLESIQGRLARMQEDDPAIAEEHMQIQGMIELARSTSINAKGTALREAIASGFAQLAKLGANKKAIIFTEYRATQQYLYDLLNKGPLKGKVLTYSGEKSRDFTIMDRFREEAQILITTDTAAEGFNLEFCSFVINFDLPYNTLTIEQRINRCHRQGQQSDVLVLSFLNRNNFADVRTLELINKRILQFSGIFGMTDNILGCFDTDFSRIAHGARTKEEIEQSYQETLLAFETENTQTVRQAEDALFSSFSGTVTEDITVTPQYFEQEAARLNDQLWALTRYFFEGKLQFTLDDETRTVSCVGSPPKVFTGAAMRRNEYSMRLDYQPRSGRHTITGTLARNILQEIFWKGMPEHGTITINENVESCRIGYYRVRIKPKDAIWGQIDYFTFVGMMANGKTLDDAACREIMAMPVQDFKTRRETSAPDALDALIAPEAFIQRAMADRESAEKEEIDRLRRQTDDEKVQLEKALDGLRVQVRAAEAVSQKEGQRLEQLQAQKKLHALRKELKQKEQSLFFDKMRLDQALEERIAQLAEQMNLMAEIHREFVIKVVNADG